MHMPNEIIFRRAAKGKLIRVIAAAAFITLAGCQTRDLPLPTLQPTETKAATPSATPTPTDTLAPTETLAPTPTPDVAYNIYDINSFPAEMKAVAMDPMKATPEQQAAYQQFLDNQRQKFFAEKGIQQVVEKMVASGKIFPEQAGLWGMTYWESIQAEHKMIVLGPEDLKQARIIEDDYHKKGLGSWRDERSIGGTTKVWSFGYDVTGATVYGIFEGVGTFDNTGNWFPLIAVLDQDGKWSIAVRSLVPKDLVIPQGSTCLRHDSQWPGTSFILEEDAQFGEPQGNGIIKTDLYGKFGQQITIDVTTGIWRDWLRSVYNPKHPREGGVFDISCNYPYKDVYMAGGIVVPTVNMPYPGSPFESLEQKK